MSSEPQSPGLQSLAQLLAQGQAVAATKQQPKTRLHGDWQSTETVYAVVSPEAFTAWRGNVLAYLQATYGPESEVYQAFLQRCRLPQYLEVLNGLRQLERLQADAADDGCR